MLPTALTGPTLFLVINIIISTFLKDNVFSMNALLPWGPPMNTDTVYYQGFLVIFVMCNFNEKTEATACLKMLNSKQGSHWYHFLTPLGTSRPS